MIRARADTVGSLLRPPELKVARKHYATGAISAAEFKRIEDRAVDGAVRLQEEAGLEVVTDGEMRRESFQSQLAETVEGLGEPSIDAYLWGDWRGGEEVGDKLIVRPENLGVVGKLRRKRHLSVEEFVYLRARTSRIPKVTLPSPSLFANFWLPEASGGSTLPSTLSWRTSQRSYTKRSPSSSGSAPPTSSWTRRNTPCSSKGRPAASTKSGAGTSTTGSRAASSSTTT